MEELTPFEHAIRACIIGDYTDWTSEDCTEHAKVVAARILPIAKEQIMKELNMEKKEHYYGLSPEDCMDLYSEKHQAFLTEWERPLERKLDQMIRNRIKEIAGDNQQGTGDYYSVILPFELPFPDGDTGEIKYWRFLDIEKGYSTLQASRIDEHENTVFCTVPHDLDTLYVLYRNLKRMGFWDEEWRHSFVLE